MHIYICIHMCVCAYVCVDRVYLCMYISIDLCLYIYIECKHIRTYVVYRDTREAGLTCIRRDPSSAEARARIAGPLRPSWLGAKHR